MREELAIRYIPQRVSERGFSRHRMVFQDLNLRTGQSIKLTAYNEIWMLLNADDGLLIRSSFGIYDHRNQNLRENIHEHGDEIIIENNSNQPAKVSFIQVILMN